MENKLKIAYLGQKGIENVVGGVETHVKELAFRVSKAGNDVIVYARPYTTNQKNKYFGNLLVKKLPSLHTKHLDAISHTFLATLDAIFSKADVFHYHGVGPSLLSFLPRIFRPSALVVVTFHSIDREHAKWGGFAKFILRLGEWTACRFPHVTITVSKTLANYCWEKYQRKTIMIPNGITNYAYLEANLIRKKFALEKNSYLLVLSRLVAHKNIHLVIEAFKKVRTDLKLVIAGNSTYTDQYIEYLKNLAKDDPRIIFTGPCLGETLQEIFSNCLFYINASDAEGCPTTVIEAMGYGKTVLVSDLNVNREVVKQYGYYFKQGNVQALQKQLERLIVLQLVELNDKKNPQEYVAKNFHWNVLAPRVISVYKNFHKNLKLLKDPAYA